MPKRTKKGCSESSADSENMLVSCPQCSKITNVSNKFCGHCGNSLDSFSSDLNDKKGRSGRKQRTDKKENKKTTILSEKQQAKEEARVLEKARRAELKADKEQVYIIRKNTGLKVLRFTVWIMLVVILVRGILVSLRPDPTAEIHKTIATFKSEFTGYQEKDNEILAFAQNFAVQFLSYESSGEANYIERIRPYCTEAIVNAGYKFPAGTSAKVTYANAYRKKEYSSTQTDVWVLLTVEYTSKQLSNDGIITEENAIESTTVKIPVKMNSNRYIVEDLPAFVNDNMKISGHQAVQYSGRECSSDITEAIKTALTNFYKAYYEQAQEVINYFLAPNADASQFVGLNNRVAFDRVDTIRVYYKNETATTDFVVILTLSITDKNGVKVNQNFHLDVILKDNQYYVVQMNTRNTNLMEGL